MERVVFQARYRYSKRQDFMAVVHIDTQSMPRFFLRPRDTA